MYFVCMNLCIRGYIPVIAGKYDIHAHMCLGRLALLLYLIVVHRIPYDFIGIT